MIISGGGITVGVGALEVVNSIIHGNAAPTSDATAQQIHVRETCPTDVSFDQSLIEGGWMGQGAGNIDADPRFVDPGSDAGDSLAAAADPLADLDASGAVDFTDLNLLLDAWGDSCIAAGAR
ncbi:hypothetical protein [Pyruvatibacter sp.]|uniref:hypothetical protein n=1 Tax=Pyruvatibacter sp. TaxID=1981328 RepID=UPI0032EFAB67